jgi:hypothetical protein
MIKEVAKHSLGAPAKKRGRPRQLAKRDADREVAAIAQWLRKRARRIERDERRITGRQLRRILNQHGFELRDPKNNSIAVCRSVERRKGLTLKKVTLYERVCNITYRGDTQLVGLNEVKLVRKLCELDALHGDDSQSFYNSDDPVAVWINDYRSVLERLSKE